MATIKKAKTIKPQCAKGECVKLWDLDEKCILCNNVVTR